MEILAKIKAKQTAIAADMLSDINDTSLNTDAIALRARMMSYRRQIVATTSELGQAIAELENINLQIEALG